MSAGKYLSAVAAAAQQTVWYEETGSALIRQGDLKSLVTYMVKEKW